MKTFLPGLLAFTFAVGTIARCQERVTPAASLCPPTAAGPECISRQPTKTICIPEQYLKRNTKVVYSSGSEPMCLSYRHGLFGCLACDQGRCANPLIRRYLIKKTQVCEQPATRCVPVEVPACADHATNRCRPNLADDVLMPRAR